MQNNISGKNDPMDKGSSQQELSKFTLREVVFKYLAHLPLFLLSLTICIGASVLYIRYKVPVFKAATSMLVKGSEESNSFASSGNSSDLIQSALYGGKRVNLDNEIELMRSKTNLAKVIARGQFNIDYYIDGSIKRTNIYKSNFFELVPIKILDSSKSCAFFIKNISNKGGVLIKKKNSQSENDTKVFHWNEPVFFNGMEFKLQLKTVQLDTAERPVTDQGLCYVIWQPVYTMAGAIQSALSIGAGGKTTIVQLALKSENVEKAKDILNAFIAQYNQQSIDEKNKIAENTIKFIDDRLALVASELSDVEGNLKEYKSKNKIIDAEKQAGSISDDYKATEAKQELLDFKIYLLNDLQKYLSASPNKDRLVPSNLGVEDFTLTALIGKYNELQLQRQALAPIVLSNNKQLIAANNELDEIRRNILEGIANLQLVVQSQQKDIKNKLNEYSENLASIPQKQRALQEIMRQQSVKQGLYLYLLQKREETAISTASTSSNYQQIDPAESQGQIEPKEGNIRLFAFLLGLLIPIAIIYILDLLNDKLTTRDDIVQRLQQPIVGEISHVADKTLSNVVVGQSRNMIAEQFRILRSNMQFLIDKQNPVKTYLVTSSISGEGKSFISLNLAAVLSLSGKKVALLEFDLRKMRGGHYDGEKQNAKGITNYLIGQTDSPADIITTLQNYPDLNIFRSGPIPPNPAELVMSDKIKILFEWLQHHYDYIVIDSAPVGLVSDAFALVEYSNAVLYVLRQRYTHKRQIDFVADLCRQEKLKNVALVVNDVHMGGKYGYYGYGYGYGYGYIYRYGFGYKYGYGVYGKKYFGKDNQGYFDVPSKKQ
ncbi:GumC family protein [Chitinophagaceae bacterium LWZ2-11]